MSETFSWVSFGRSYTVYPLVTKLSVVGINYRPFIEGGLGVLPQEILHIFGSELCNFLHSEWIKFSARCYSWFPIFTDQHPGDGAN